MTCRQKVFGLETEGDWGDAARYMLRLLERYRIESDGTKVGSQLETGVLDERRWSIEGSGGGCAFVNVWSKDCFCFSGWVGEKKEVNERERPFWSLKERDVLVICSNEELNRAIVTLLERCSEGRINAIEHRDYEQYCNKQKFRISGILEVSAGESFTEVSIDKKILEYWTERHEGLYCRINLTASGSWLAANSEIESEIALDGGFHLADGVTSKSVVLRTVDTNRDIMGELRRVDHQAAEVVDRFIDIADKSSRESQREQAQLSRKEEVNTLELEEFKKFMSQKGLDRVSEVGWSSIEVLEAVAEAELQYRVRLGVDDIMAVKDLKSLWKKVLKKL